MDKPQNLDTEFRTFVATLPAETTGPEAAQAFMAYVAREKQILDSLASDLMVSCRSGQFHAFVDALAEATYDECRAA